eukprot:TRINITY_DN972_c0_g1_i2.p1 TRINITY_DN972_c0_g1~~TRINITY_DN972_c0_g1_i2.p1  ORF type:complete len:804 (-),score=186.18 TRINITY_DN972_c0_g1_i2:89-2500(-)
MCSTGTVSVRTIPPPPHTSPPGAHDLIGATTLVLSDIVPNATHDMWHDIYPDPSEQQVFNNVGRKMRDSGWKPLLPLVLVPDFASSALVVQECPKDVPWAGEAVWLALSRIGTRGFNPSTHSFGFHSTLYKTVQNLTSLLGDGEVALPENPEDTEFRTNFVRHICLDPTDGCSDPPEIKVRAVQHKNGAMYLDPTCTTSNHSWVMGPLIENLEDFGYVEGYNMETCPYDWRLPPQNLEERDHFFSDLQARIEQLVSNTGNKVCLLGHSMGNRIIQYFLHLMAKKEGGQKWIDEHVFSFIAVAAPFLGTPKMLRALCTGDKLGLETLLRKQDALRFERSLGSAPWLLPLSTEHYFNEKGSAFAYVQSPDGIGSICYKPLSVREALTAAGAQKSLEFFDKYYLTNPLFGGPAGSEVVLQAPPVQRLHAFYGVNVPTETMYFYEKGEHGFTFDKNPAIALEGYRVCEGVVYETETTPQQCILSQTGVHGTRSGDGTVPYESLSFCSTWRSKINDLRIQELNKVEHHDILRNKLFWQLLIDKISQPPPPSVATAEPPSRFPIENADKSILLDLFDTGLSGISPPCENLSDVDVCLPAKSDVIRAGFLTKQGEVWKNWKRRFFVLSAKCLVYYHSPSAAAPKGIIALADVTEARSASFAVHNEQRRGFVVVTPAREYNMFASSKQESKEWLQSLQSVLAQCTGPSIVKGAEPESGKVSHQGLASSGSGTKPRRALSFNSFKRLSQHAAASPPAASPLAPQPASASAPLARTRTDSGPALVVPSPSPTPEQAVATTPANLASCTTPSTQ